jgi:deoxycytidine triphosphate deaminase
VILTDREIRLAIQNRLIVIDPAPNEKAFSSTAIDLTLDENISELKEGEGGLEQAIDPSHKTFSPNGRSNLFPEKL